MDDSKRTTEEDEDIARLLRAAGPRQQLASDMNQRWEQHFRAQLTPVLDRRQRGRRRLIMGLCASIALVAVAISLMVSLPATVPLSIRITHVSGNSRLLLPNHTSSALLAGEQAPAGSMIITGEDGLVTVEYGDYDLRLNRETRLLLGDQLLVLEAGEIYASDYDLPQQHHPLRINTAHGAIRDIGTQFTVMSYPDRTVTTVRRGAVLIDTGEVELRTEALPGSASRVTVDRNRQIHSESADPDGDHWNWIYASRAAFKLEGRSAYEFLTWSVGESGLRLEFASEGAELNARATRLHGDLAGLDPEQAVQPVLASTDLIAERGANHSLRVSLRAQP